MKRLFTTAAVLMALVAVSKPANAATLSLGDPTADWTFTFSGPDHDITADLSITLVSLSSTEAVLQVELTNTTTAAGANDAITAVGFNTSPDATGISGATTGFAGDPGDDTDTFDSFTLEDDLTGNFKDIDVCAFPDACNGGTIQNGIGPGEYDVFQITLTGSWGDSIDISGTAIKFQGDQGSFEFGGDGDGSGDGDGVVTDGDGSGDGDGVVTSEPASLLLLGSAFAFAASRARRRRT